MGILYDDYVEIHKGKRIRQQRYEDIKRFHKSHVSGIGVIWFIGKVRIFEAVGARKKHIASNEQAEKFMEAVMQRLPKEIE